MKEKQFNSIAGELFSKTLAPFGFTNEGSKHCTFYRRVNDEVYHFVAPGLSRSGTRYDIRVFPHSPLIDPQFTQNCPDGIGIPTDSWSNLCEYDDGVGLSQQYFNCKYEDNLRQRFALTVAPLLVNVAIPYLNQFQSVADMIPALRHESCLGFALHHAGRKSEAFVYLHQYRDRLRNIIVMHKNYADELAYVEKLLEEYE